MEYTCGHCGGESKVKKIHMIFCMDCFKDFWGQEYEANNMWVTELKPYAAKGFVSKEKKGEKKQNTWEEMVQSVLDEQKSALANVANVLRIIEAVSKHTNIPLKKRKFINIMKNVCGHKTNPKDIDQAWDLISVKLSELSNANNRNQNQTIEALNEVKETDNVKGSEVEQEDSSQNSTEVQNNENDDSSQKTYEKKLNK